MKLLLFSFITITFFASYLAQELCFLTDDCCPHDATQCNCTFTQGYWGQIEGQNPRFPGEWIDEFETCTLCGILWIDILNTPPCGESKWFILAHQYITLQLNLAHGSCLQDNVLSINITDAIDILTNISNCPIITPMCPPCLGPVPCGGIGQPTCATCSPCTTPVCKAPVCTTCTGTPCTSTTCDFITTMSAGDESKATDLTELFDFYNNGGENRLHHCNDITLPDGPSPTCDEVCTPPPECPCCDQCPCECPCDCPPPPQCTCTLTQGFWKNHPEVWDESLVGATLCGISFMTILQTAVSQGAGGTNGIPWYQLAHQYISALLNINHGSCFDGISNDNMIAARLLLVNNCPPNFISATVKTQMEQLATLLEAYNSGEIGPGHCENDIVPIPCQCPEECPPPPQPCGPKDGCVRSQGFWKTQTALWAPTLNPNDPASFCAQHTWLYYLTQSPTGDAYYILTKQYIAAFLNINSPLTTACASPQILAVMANAFSLLSLRCGVVIGTSHPDRPLFIAYGAILDNFNNGFGSFTGDGPDHC